MGSFCSVYNEHSKTTGASEEGISIDESLDYYSAHGTRTPSTHHILHTPTLYTHKHADADFLVYLSVNISLFLMTIISQYRKINNNPIRNTRKSCLCMSLEHHKCNEEREKESIRHRRITISKHNFNKCFIMSPVSEM